jgi:hypothetical protein
LWNIKFQVVSTGELKVIGELLLAGTDYFADEIDSVAARAELTNNLEPLCGIVRGMVWGEIAHRDSANVLSQ